jgi:hypothetical protein
VLSSVNRPSSRSVQEQHVQAAREHELRFATSSWAGEMLENAEHIAALIDVDETASCSDACCRTEPIGVGM